MTIEIATKKHGEHEKAGDRPEDLTVREIDGDENTGHRHFTQEEFEKCVDDLMANSSINEAFSRKEVEETLLKSIYGKNHDVKNIDKKSLEEVKVNSIEEIKSNTEKQLEEESVHVRTPNKQ